MKELCSILNLSKDKMEDVRHMVGLVTQEKWGANHWIEVLIGTCIYIVARQHRLPLSAAQIASTVNCAPKDVLRVYNRVLNYLEIESCPFDPIVHFDKFMSSHSAFVCLGEDTLNRLVEQGHCLLHYGLEWSLTSGRHPLALVAAVVAIVGKANNIKVDLDLISRELYVYPKTSRLRLREYFVSLIGFAQLLPWGKDITFKTLTRHLPFLLQYMAARTKVDSRSHVKRKFLPSDSVASAQKQCSSAEDTALRHIAKALYAKYGTRIKSILENQSLDVVKDEDGIPSPEEEISHPLKKQKVNEEGYPSVETCRQDTKLKVGRKTGKATVDATLWKPLPPSFVANTAAIARRTAKVDAAKKRIAAVKQEMGKYLPSEEIQGCNNGMALQLEGSDFFPMMQHLESPALSMEARVLENKKVCDGTLDAEDLIIQYCLVRGADEEILKAGYYSLALSTPPVQPDKEILSDMELLKYFRTPSEVEFLRSLSEEDSPYPWFTAEELELQALQ
ncbi:hypothetical protein KP509_08G005300 [Ceratopteris richardii]|nr:hypothetical protein KP509_08G005300 [Ceratopteris richardii]